MGRTMLRFKDMNDRHTAIALLERAHSLFRRGRTKSVCDAVVEARNQLHADNVDYNRRLLRVCNKITQRIMGSLDNHAYVTGWLYWTCPAYMKWQDKQPYGFDRFEARRIRRYRQDWIADMIRTMRAGGFI